MGKKEWNVPETGAAAKVLAELGLASEDPAPDYSVLNGLGLYPFQMDGVKSLWEKRLCGILNDLPGSGKTAQTIAAVLAMGAMPCVVLCPKKKAPQWMKELCRFAPNARVMRIDEEPPDGFSPMSCSDETDFYLCPYESLEKHGEPLIGARCVIVDECHRLNKKPVMESERGFTDSRQILSFGEFEDYCNTPQGARKFIDWYIEDYLESELTNECSLYYQKPEFGYRKSIKLFLKEEAFRKTYDNYMKTWEKQDVENARRMKEYRAWHGYAWRILEKAYCRLFMSGYQCEKKPTKYYQILKFLCPDRNGSFRDFGNKYCDTRPSDWAHTGFTYYGGVNMEELLDLVRGVFVGRKIGEIEEQIPEKKKKK